MSLKPTIDDNVELEQRLARIRRLCDDLETALDTANEQRELIKRMKIEADALHSALQVMKDT